MRANGQVSGPVHLFFIRTPFFSLSLDVLIFPAISASDVLIDVLRYFCMKYNKNISIDIVILYFEYS